MKLSSLLMRSTLVLLAILFSGAVSKALADTYVLYNLSDANDRNLIGITAGGEAVLFYGNCTTGAPSGCYQTYDDGALVATSATAPSFTYDDGSACSLPSGFTNTTGGAVCNGSKTGFESFSSPNGASDGVYVGTLGDLTNVGVFSDGGEKLNASGDLLFVDGKSEYIYEAIDTSIGTAAAPEPSSLFLLGTGVISAAGALRRRTRIR